MYSWEAFEPSRLRPGGVVTNAFLRLSIADFQSAARFVRSLPYGRNSGCDEALIVLTEGRGTCSTKHALMRRLAVEQELNIALVIGIYEMTAANTAGVGKVLSKYQLHALPEAHCYLRTEGRRVDITRAAGPAGIVPIKFLYEEDIDPAQIGRYKVDLHRQFLYRWMKEADPKSFSLEDLWRVREECIAALEQMQWDQELRD
jgi:hypothetical protein